MSTPIIHSRSNGAAATVCIEMSEPVDAAGGSEFVASYASLPLTVWLLFVCGFFTMTMDLATAIYKPPRGVLFVSHRLAYYMVLAAIFIAGLVEVSVAFWLSRYERPHAFLKAILCASVVPFVAAIALGGFTVLLKA